MVIIYFNFTYFTLLLTYSTINLFNFIIFYSLTNDLCEHISKTIVEIFPTETPETYYIPPIKKKDSIHNKSVISKGKLISMWRNKRYKNNLLLKKVKEETVKHGAIQTGINFYLTINEYYYPSLIIFIYLI
jgi:hypothetical protein